MLRTILKMLIIGLKMTTPLTRCYSWKYACKAQVEASRKVDLLNRGSVKLKAEMETVYKVIDIQKRQLNIINREIGLYLATSRRWNG